jgi:hypothetical protein
MATKGSRGAHTSELASTARTVGTVAGSEDRLMSLKPCYGLPYVHRLCSMTYRASL